MVLPQKLTKICRQLNSDISMLLFNEQLRVLKDCVDPLREIKATFQMDATPNFGVSMDNQVPSNPQLTLI